MNAGGVDAVVMSPADRFGIGPGRHRRHAVDLLEAMPLIDEGRRRGRAARDVELRGVCGERVTLARKWGRYDYANPHLSTRRCERCGWIVALHLGTVEDEIASYAPDPVERGLISSTGHDPDLLPAIVRAVLAAHDSAVSERLEPAVVPELLAHISRHRPVGVVCEGCWDGGIEDTHGVGATHCPEAIVACWACTFIAGFLGRRVRRHHRVVRVHRAVPVFGADRRGGVSRHRHHQCDRRIAMINVDAVRSAVKAVSADADTPRAAVVGVLAAPGRRRRQARCGCGWDGPRRWLLPKAAVVDALTHARTRGCVPAYPLVQAAGEPATWRADDGAL